MYRNWPPCTVVVNGEICFRNQNHFLDQAVNMSFFFGANLKWPFKEFFAILHLLYLSALEVVTWSRYYHYHFLWMVSCFQAGNHLIGCEKKIKYRGNYSEVWCFHDVMFLWHMSVHLYFAISKQFSDQRLRLNTCSLL